MKRTSNLSNKTKAELTAMARRKKIPVTSGMLKDALIKAIKKGLRKIETQKKPKTATTKTRKQTPVAKTAKKTTKKKSPKTSKAKTAPKPKSSTRKTTSTKQIKTSVKKKTARKKSPAKEKVKKAPAKKSAPRKTRPAKSKTGKTAAKKSSTSKRKTTRAKKAAPSAPRSRPAETDLPERYGDHRLVVLARDANWAYAYWDLDPARIRDLLHSAGQTTDKARWVLRIYSAALHPAEEKGRYFDIDIDVKTGCCYLDLSRPGARFIVKIGVMDASGMFRTTAQSNPVILPLDHPSKTIAPEGTAPSKTPTSPSGSSFTKPPSSWSQ